MLTVADLESQFVAASANAESELDLALLVAQLIDPETDPVSIRAELVQFQSELALQETKTTTAILDALRKAGLGQADRQSQSAVTAQHSHIGWVLAHRQGIPISLAVILIFVARQSGLPAWGVNYPGHFLVNVHGELIDPLTLDTVDASQLEKGNRNAAAMAQMLQRTTPQSFVLRMLNNLKALQMAQQNWSGVLDLIDYQIAICHDEPALVATLEYERAQCWQQLGAFSVAAEAFDRCARQTAEPELARQASNRAQALRRRQEVLH